MQFQSSRNRASAYAATLAFVFLASSSPAVIRLSLTHTLGAVDLLLLRCFIGGLLFLPFLLRSWRRYPPNLMVMGLVLAILHGWGMHLTAIAGLRFAPAAHASALGPGLVPVWVMVWRMLIYGERPNTIKTVGLALIALGALLLVGYSSRAMFENRMLIGDMLFMVSSLLAAAYLVYVQQHSLDPMQVTALVAVYSAIAGSVLFLAWPVPSALWTAPISEVLFQAAFQGFGMGVCSVLFASHSAIEFGSQRFAVFVAAIPILSLPFGRSVAGDPIHPYEAAAAVLVGAGIVIAGFLSGRDARSRAGPTGKSIRPILGSD